MNYVWFKSLDCGYTWALLNATLPATLVLIVLVTAAELIHKAATVTFNNAHIARAINTRHRLMKTKQKKSKIPSPVQSAYINESYSVRDISYH